MISFLILKAPITTAADNDIFLTLKALITTAAVLNIFCFSKIMLVISCESSAKQRIHMKQKALFSSKDKSENNKSAVCCHFAWCFKG